MNNSDYILASGPASMSNLGALTLTRQAGDGTALSLDGTLTLGQWRAALTLLAAAEGAR